MPLKTAEKWMRELSEDGSVGGVGCMATVNTSDIRKIQLNAMKEVARWAAKEANKLHCRPGGGTALEVKQAILAKTEQWTEKDLHDNIT